MTPLAHCRFTARAARRLVVWCLLVALPVYGLSATLVQLVGASHVHRQQAETVGSLDGWQDFRRVAPGGVVAHAAPHAHAAFARHHHAQDDASVVALDARADDDGAASAGTPSGDGSATLVLALAGSVALQAPAHRRHAWPLAEPAMPAGCDARLAERPPRA